MTQHPLLVDAAWLAEHRTDPDLVLLDATTILVLPEGDGYYTVNSGVELYRAAHIPGAVFADLHLNLADQSAEDTFTVLDSADFAERIGALGVGDGKHVVVYDQGGNLWATRLWWNLRLEGFDSISVLDGGLPAWRAADLPVESGDLAPTPAVFTARRRPELLARKDEVLAAVSDEKTVLVNSLDRPTFTGEKQTYARPGRIPSSENVPFGALVTAQGRFIDLEEQRPLLDAADTLDGGNRVVTYCGGGIAATAVAFSLARLGRNDVAVYDGSLTEWTKDDALPLEIGEPV